MCVCFNNGHGWNEVKTQLNKQASQLASLKGRTELLSVMAVLYKSISVPTSTQITQLWSLQIMLPSGSPLSHILLSSVVFLSVLHLAQSLCSYSHSVKLRKFLQVQSQETRLGLEPHEKSPHSSSKRLPYLLRDDPQGFLKIGDRAQPFCQYTTSVFQM